MIYSSDIDLQNIRPQVMDYGIDDFSEFHREAGVMIDRYLSTAWYPGACVVNGYSPYTTQFDASLLILPKPGFRMAAAYLTLSLIYEFLSKDTEDCPFRDQSDRYQFKFKAEIDAVIEAGIAYDWDNVVELSDPDVKPVRRLMRS